MGAPLLLCSHPNSVQCFLMHKCQMTKSINAAMEIPLTSPCKRTSIGFASSELTLSSCCNLNPSPLGHTFPGSSQPVADHRGSVILWLKGNLPICLGSTQDFCEGEDSPWPILLPCPSTSSPSFPLQKHLPSKLSCHLMPWDACAYHQSTKLL